MNCVVAFFGTQSNTVTGVASVAPSIYEATGALHNRAILDACACGQGWQMLCPATTGLGLQWSVNTTTAVPASLRERPAWLYRPAGVAPLFVPDTSSDRGAETAGTSERLSFTRGQLSLNVTQLADVLRVTRQTVYDWLTGEAKPRAEQSFRIKALYDVARDWSRISGTPIGDLLTTPVLDGISLIEALRAKMHDPEQIRSVLHVLQETIVVREAIPLSGRTAAQAAAAYGYAIPDATEQERRRSAASRRARRTR